jgi:hypothetical protein
MGKKFSFLPKIKNFFFGNNCQKEEDVDLAGQKAKKLTCTDAYYGAPTQDYIFEKGGNLFQIHFIKTDAKLSDVYNKIIASLSFQK